MRWSRQIVAAYFPSGQLETTYIQKGLWAVLQDSTFTSETAESVYEGDFGKNEALAAAQHYNKDSHVIDLESDIYTFSFNGYNGKFIIGLDGKAIILSGDYAEIDLTDMQVQKKERHFCTHFSITPLYLQPQKSAIVITTLDGYRYTFGGRTEALEFVQTLPSNDNNYTMEPDIMGWMLSSIEAPNGRTIRFHYAPLAASDVFSSVWGHTDEIYKAYWSAKRHFLPV